MRSFLLILFKMKDDVSKILCDLFIYFSIYEYVSMHNNIYKYICVYTHIICHSEKP